MSAMNTPIQVQAGDHVMHMDGGVGVVREMTDRFKAIVDWDEPRPGVDPSAPIATGYLQRIPNKEMHP